MISDKEKICRYFDAYLDKKWSVVFDPATDHYWIIDIKNSYWVARLFDGSKCWLRIDVVDEISLLYDTNRYDAREDIAKTLRAKFNHNYTKVYMLQQIQNSEVKKVINRGIIKG